MIARVSAITRSSSTTRTLGLLCGEVIFIARCWMQNLAGQQLRIAHLRKNYIDAKQVIGCQLSVISSKQNQNKVKSKIRVKDRGQECPRYKKRKFGLTESVTYGRGSGGR